jgi:DNA-3-methyladenine glycosylase
MEFQVRMGDPLWRAVGQRRLTIAWADESPPTIADVLAHLSVTYSDFEAALADAGLRQAYPYRYFVDSRLVAVADLASRTLRAGETLYIFLPAAGGESVSPLPRAFYARDTVTVARALLGQELVRVLVDGQQLRARIVETEAYGGTGDLASHAARGRTPRSAIMFGEAGYAYVYFIYGMYFCLNAVTESDGVPGAVLIRGAQPITGIETMHAHRPRARSLHDLCSGPGKLCQALAIDRTLNGHDLVTGGPLYLEAGVPPSAEGIVATPRVGIRADAWGLQAPWRFVLAG